MASAKILLPLTSSAIGLQLRGPMSLTHNTAGQNSIRLLRLFPSNDPLRNICVEGIVIRTAASNDRSFLSEPFMATVTTNVMPLASAKGISSGMSTNSSSMWTNEMPRERRLSGMRRWLGDRSCRQGVPKRQDQTGGFGALQPPQPIPKFYRPGTGARPFLFLWGENGKNGVPQAPGTKRRNVGHPAKFDSVHLDAVGGGGFFW